MTEYSPAIVDIFRLPRILGTFPFDKKFALSKKWFAYSLLSCLLMLALAADSYIHPQDYKYHTMQLLRETSLACNSVPIPFFLYWLVYKRDHVRNMAEEINQKLVIFPIFSKAQNHIVSDISLLLLLCSITSVHVYSMVQDASPWQLQRDLLITVLSVAHIYSFLKQFCQILRLLSMLYRYLNKIESRESVLVCHELSKVVDAVKEVYKPQLLLLITFDFVLFILTLFCLFSPLYVKDSFTVAVYLCFTLIYICPVILLIHHCNRVVDQATKFNQKLHQRVAEDKTKQLLNDDRLNLHFIVYQDPNFTACGFFSLDNSLICSMISVSTTYLAIVLQYSKE